MPCIKGSYNVQLKTFIAVLKLRHKMMIEFRHKKYLNQKYKSLTLYLSLQQCTFPREVCLVVCFL